MASVAKSKRSLEPESQTKRVAIYCRVSTAGQEEDGTSLDTQEQRCRAYSVTHGYVVDDQHVYRDVHTGTEWKERPALTRMREAIRTRQVDVVVCYAIDRLSRHQAHLAILADEVEEHKARLEFVTESFEDSAVGRFIRNAKAFAAEVEREKIVERSVRGKRARAESGKMIPARRPLYGYRWNDNRTSLVPDDTTRGVIDRIYRDYLKGSSLRKITLDLVADQIPRPAGPDANGDAGTRWGSRTVWLILTNRAYIGEAEAFRYSKTGTAVALPAGTVPAIVDRDLFDAVQVRLSQNKGMATRNNKSPHLTLLRGGFVRCGQCNWAMHTYNNSSQGRKVLVYRCSRGYKPGFATNPEDCKHVITASVLDKATWSQIRRILLHPEIIAAELERMREQDPLTDDLAAVERTLKAIARQQRNLIEHLANVNGTAGAAITSKLNDLGDQRTQLIAEREAILSRTQEWEHAQERLGSIQAWCQSIAANIDTLSYDEKRLALSALGVKVRVWRPQHDPRYKIDAVIPLDAPIVDTTPASKNLCIQP
jgi:site-specific DNA recombinase